MPHCSPSRNAENRSCPSWRRPRLRAHPGGTAEFSAADPIVDDALAAVARDLGASKYASVTFAGSTTSPVVTARLCTLATRDAHTGPPSARCKLVDPIRVAGHALLLMPAPRTPCRRRARRTQRSRWEHLRPPGPDVWCAGQRTLAGMRTAKIGMGGAGSAVARPARQDRLGSWRPARPAPGANDRARSRRRRKASSAGPLSLSQLAETDDIGMTPVMGK